MKILTSLASVISIRALNILGNAAVGVVLARQLSLLDRGYVAAISSVIGISVILIASPKGEDILKNQKVTLHGKIPKKVTFHFWQFVMIALISIGYFFFAIELKLTFLTCVLFCALIYSSSINSLRQAFMFHEFGTFGHQLALTLHSITYALFLLSAFTFLDAHVNVWLLALLCTDLLLLAALRKINNDVLINFKWNLISRNQRISCVAEKSFIEKISVYVAAFYLQLIIISASILYSTDLLAYFAIGLSLTTLISLPITPFLPRIISNSKEFIAEFQSLKKAKFLLILIGIIFYLVCATKAFQVFIPILYGAKYYVLVGYTPVIVLCGVMIGCVSIITALLRGLKKYSLSMVVSSLGLFSFTFGAAILVIFDQDIYQAFLLLLVSNLVSVLAGIIILSSRKVLKP